VAQSTRASLRARGWDVVPDITDVEEVGQASVHVLERPLQDDAKGVGYLASRSWDF